MIAFHYALHFNNRWGWDEWNDSLIKMWTFIWGELSMVTKRLIKNYEMGWNINKKTCVPKKISTTLFRMLSEQLSTTGLSLSVSCTCVHFVSNRFR